MKKNKAFRPAKQLQHKIVVIGAGYVGLVSAVCWAKLGHLVYLVETNPQRVTFLQSGVPPFFEPHLENLLAKNLNRNLFIYNDLATAMNNNPSFVFLCVGTPAKSDGSADLSQVWAATENFCKQVKNSCTFICKSTLPVGSTSQIEQKINARLAGHEANLKISVAFVPEFLSQGQAIKNFLQPDRVVVGATSRKVVQRLKALYKSVLTKRATFFGMDFGSAELVKYAANAMLATRISFINQIANFAEKTGGNITQIAKAVGADPRIGSHFLQAGLGFGGSCLPKDLAALVNDATQCKVTMSIASAALQANFEQRERFLQKILAIYPSLQAKRVGLVGLAFKPGTDDLRESPAVWLAEQLSQRGAQVLAFDPLCQTQPNCPNLKFTASFTELLAQDFLVIANDFAFLRKMHPQQFFKLTDHRIFDGRNCFRANYFAKTVVEYYCIGRKAFICK